MIVPGTVVWTPPADIREHSRIGDYLRCLERERGLSFDDYHALWQWSVSDLSGFWGSIWDYFGVGDQLRDRAIRDADGAGRPAYDAVLGSDTMPGARWFTGARLNYAEHMLRNLPESGPVVLGRSQTRAPVDLTPAELRAAVARARAGLHGLGVGRGDRVAAYLPNIPEALVLLLATASLGAVFSSCAPEFGTRSVVDRWSQIEPTVLVAVDGYRYGAKEVDRTGEVAAIRAALPKLQHVVVLPYLSAERAAGSPTHWRGTTCSPGRTAGRSGRRRAADVADLVFEPVPVRPSAVRAVLLRHHRPAEADRARARRHPARAPQGAGAALRPGPGRPILLVLDDRLDDVERRSCPDWRSVPRSCWSTETRATPTSVRCGGWPTRPA